MNLSKCFLVSALAIVALSSNPALASEQSNVNEARCVVKQKNAASYTLAQQVSVPVQGVLIIGFEHGIWTEAAMDNVGSDTVTVKVGNRETRDMVIKRFRVSAKQIGGTDNCNNPGVFMCYTFSVLFKE